MAITSLDQALWSDLLLKGTQGQLAYQDVIENVGQIKGKSVHFTNIGAVTVSDYTKDTNISNQTLTDSGITVSMDQAKYFSVNVDDINTAQTDVDIMTEVIRKGTFGLKNQIDTYIASLYADAGIVADLGDDITPIDINSSNVLTYLRLISQKLDEANADTGSRWIVIPPWMKNKLFTALPALDTNNSEMLKSGYIGAYDGLKIYWSNNVPNTTGTLYKVMAGDGDAFRFGMNVEKIEGLRNSAQFGDVVRGLMVYGAEVTQDSTLVCMTADPAVDV